MVVTFLVKTILTAYYFKNQQNSEGILCKTRALGTFWYTPRYLSAIIVLYFNLRTTFLGPGLQILSRQTVSFTKTKKSEHTVPLFINANSLTLNFLYYKNFSELMHDVRNASAQPKLCNLFTNTSSIHSYNTRSAASNKCLRKTIKA